MVNIIIAGIGSKWGGYGEKAAYYPIHYYDGSVRVH